MNRSEDKKYNLDSLLSDEELIEIVQEGAAGFEEAEEIILNRYKGLVKSKAQLYYISGGEMDDLVQEGMIGLFKAVRFYGKSAQEEKKVKASFKTFASTCINNQILTAIKKSESQKNQILNKALHLELGDFNEEETKAIFNIKSSWENDPEKVVLMKEVVDYLTSDAKDLFSPFEWKVFNEKLKGKEGAEIGRSLGKSTKSIENALIRIKKKVVAYLEK